MKLFLPQNSWKISKKIIDDASSSSMSPEEEKILGEYSKLQQNALAKQTSHGKLRGEFSYEVIEQLQKVGWKESRS